MRGRIVKVEITAEIELTAEDAAVINHVTSYGFERIFVRECSKSVSEERIKETFQKLRAMTSPIVQASQDAKNALFGVKG